MKHRLIITLIFMLVVSYAAPVSTSLQKSVAAQETKDFITAFDFNPLTGMYVTAHSSDWTVRIWDANNNHLLHTIQVPDFRSKYSGYVSIESVVFSPSGDRVAIAAWGERSGPILVVDTSTGEILLEISTMGSVSAIAWNPDGRYLAGFYDYSPLTEMESGSYIEHFIVLWDAETGEELKQSLFSSFLPSSLDWDPIGNTLIFPDFIRGVIAWDVESWQELYTLPAEGAISVAWSPAEDVFAAVDVDGVVRVWDSHTKELLRQFRMTTLEHKYSRVFWNQDGNVVGVVIHNRVEAWDMTTGSSAFSKMISQWIAGIMFTADGNPILISTDGIRW